MTKKRDRRPSGAGIAFDFSRDGTDSSVVAYTGLTRYKPFFTCPVFTIDAALGHSGDVSTAVYGQGFTNTTYVKRIDVFGNVITSNTNDCCYYSLFYNLDLINGLVTINHNLGDKYVFVEVFVDAEKVIPDEVHLIDTDNIEIDFSSFTTDPSFLFDGARVIVKCVGDSSKGGYTNSFVDGDLISGILQVTHSLGEKYVFVEVYDDSDRKIIPDEIQLIDSNTLEVDLSSFAPIAGTWNVLVKNCIDPPPPTITYQLIDSVSYSSPPDLNNFPYFSPLFTASDFTVFVYTTNRSCDRKQTFQFPPPPLPGPCCYEMTFTNADLQQDLDEDGLPDFDLDGDGDGDLLVVGHQRGWLVFIEVYDENDKKIIPDNITYSGYNLAGSYASIDLRSFTPITGTWKVIVMCCSAAPFEIPA